MRRLWPFKLPDADSQRGSIAILVLWGMALVFTLVAAAGYTSRSEVRIAGNSIASSRARYAAEAGTQLGLSRLLRRRAAGVTVFDGTPEIWQDGATRVAVSIADDAGRIDINEAPLELLEGLFAATGRPRAEALLLACNVVARRGGSLNGCPLPADLGDRLQPPTHRFLVPEELAEIPGIGDSLYAAVRDSITVATGASAIDPRDASRTVLLAIPGATPAMVDAFLANRSSWRDLAAAGDTLIPLAGAPFLMASPERDFTITAVAETAGGARFRADLQVRLTGAADPPYRVVAWRTPPAEGFRWPSQRRRAP